jgi:hypothetical protein
VTTLRGWTRRHATMAAEAAPSGACEKTCKEYEGVGEEGRLGRRGHSSGKDEKSDGSSTGR